MNKQQAVKRLVELGNDKKKMEKLSLKPLVTKIALAHPLVGEIVEDDLTEMTVKQILHVITELDKEQAEEVVDTELSPEELVKVEEEEKANDDAVVETPKDPPIFTSMCGMPFDPNLSGSCHKQCQIDFPEAFKACMENHALQPAEPPRPSSSSRAASLGMNEWYHRPGTQGGELDRFFQEGHVGTVEEIAKFANCNPRRVMIHIKHLIADFDIKILKTTRKNDDKSISTVFFWADKDKRRKGEEIEGKTGFPNGFPKGHPCYKAPATV